MGEGLGRCWRAGLEYRLLRWTSHPSGPVGRYSSAHTSVSFHAAASPTFLAYSGGWG